MSSQLGILIHIDFTPQTCFFGYFRLDSPVLGNLDSFPAYFPQLLLCYSLYTCFSQETQEEKIAEQHKIRKKHNSEASDKNQVMQDSRDPSFVSILKGHKFEHSDEALHALKEVSLNMKKNFGKFGKSIKNITKSDKAETKSILSSISTQLMYILLNSHQPLQMKMDELLLKIHDKMRDTYNIDPTSGRHKTSVCVRCGSDDSPTPPTPCECGHCGEEAEFCRCQNFSYVSNLPSNNFATNHSILVPLEGEDEIYPTRKAVKSIK